MTVLLPGVEIQKSPEIQQVRSGDTATFTIAVTNTGAVDLSDVTVTDALAPDCDATFLALAAGATETYTCDLTGETADFTNTAAVSATDPVGGTHGDTDTATVDVIAPAVSIAKTPDTQVVVTGATATFTIAVSNTGDVPLSDVTVTDPLAPDCDATIPTLAVGATESYTCDLTGVTADFTNTAAVTADDPTGAAVSASDTGAVNVVVPSIAIDKTPDLQTVGYGAEVSFTITVTNDGAADLSGITVTDALAPDCDATFPTLAVGTSETYTCVLAGVTADLTNTASVTATDVAAGTWTDTDTAAVGGRPGGADDHQDAGPADGDERR